MPAMRDEEIIAVLRHMAESSARRSELSAERSYQNAERNLSLLVHSAAALMILGLSVARYRSFAHDISAHVTMLAGIKVFGVGVLMVALGTLVVLAAGLRYLPYVLAYHRNPQLYPDVSAFLAPAFALLLGCCGIATLVYMLFCMT